MKAAERIGQVLSLFTVSTPERGTSEVAEQIGVANSSAHELLNALAGAGVLRKQAPGRFRLGPRLAALAQVLHTTDDMIAAAQPVLARLATVHGETAHVVELVGRQLAVLTGQGGNRPVRVARDLLNSETPLHAVAAGKLLVAYQPVNQRDQIVETLHLPELTEATITSRARFAAHLDKIREDGYAEALAEWHLDLATCAAPIWSNAGLCAGALSLAVPMSRYELQPRAYRTIVTEAAARISRHLGSAEYEGAVRGAWPIKEAAE